MATKDARGTKRTCQECGARFYDLLRDPITCPMCGTIYELAHAPAAPAAETKPAKEPRKPKPVVDEAADGNDEATDDADELEDIDTGEDIETEGDDSDAFLEDEEEDGGNVTDIIGGAVGEDKEES